MRRRPSIESLDGLALISALYRWQQLQLPCADCGAKPGQMCLVTRDGQVTEEPAQGFHTYRRRNGRSIYRAASEALRVATCPHCKRQLLAFRQQEHECSIQPRASRPDFDLDEILEEANRILLERGGL